MKKDTLFSARMNGEKADIDILLGSRQAKPGKPVPYVQTVEVTIDGKPLFFAELAPSIPPGARIRFTLKQGKAGMKLSAKLVDSENTTEQLETRVV